MNTLLAFVPLIVFIGVIIGIYKLTFWIKKKYPNKLWLGLLLCFLSPFGHLYLDRAWPWLIGLVISFGVIKGIIGDGGIAYLVMDALSLFCFWFRFLKAQRAAKMAT